MVDERRLVEDVEAMFQALASARAKLVFWLRVSHDDPAAPDPEALIRLVVADLDRVLDRLETRTAPPREQVRRRRWLRAG